MPLDEGLNSLDVFSSTVELQVSEGAILGDFELPDFPKGIVIFAHGSGSSRHSPRNRYVADALQAKGFGTFLLDLLTEGEAENREYVFDVKLLAERLRMARKWVRDRYPGLPIGYFGASTGAAAALAAAAEEPDIFAVVSRGGRPDLALDLLDRVVAPTLLIVGGDDAPVIEMNRTALGKLKHGKLVVIPGASHLFEETGKLEEMVGYAKEWFLRHAGDSGQAKRPA